MLYKPQKTTESRFFWLRIQQIEKQTGKVRGKFHLWVQSCTIDVNENFAINFNGNRTGPLNYKNYLYYVGCVDQLNFEDGFNRKEDGTPAHWDRQIPLQHPFLTAMLLYAT